MSRLRQTRSNHCFYLLSFYFFVCLCLLLSGCRSDSRAYIGSRGSYAGYYNRQLANFKPPQADSIQKVGETWEFHKSSEEVWEACLDVLSQYPGILNIQRDRTGGTIVVLKNIEYTYSPEDCERNVVFTRFSEQWLAVGVKAVSQRSSVLSVSRIEPSTGSLKKSDLANTLISQVKTQVFNVASWNDKYVMYENRSSKRSIKPLKINDNKSNYKYRELGINIGNWASKQLQIDCLSIRCPEVIDSIEEILKSLKYAAGYPDLETKAIVISQNSLNAFALPNGDIIISSGLLDNLENKGQLAAVLGHELSHLINHDATERLKVKMQGEAGAGAVRVAAMVADIGLQIMGAPGIGGTAARTGVNVLGEATARGLENDLIMSYKEETELQADYNGMQMIAAAGYNPQDNIDMLYAIKGVQNTFEDKTNVVSNLINMKPGIDKRILSLKEVIRKTQSK